VDLADPSALVNLPQRRPCTSRRRRGTPGRGSAATGDSRTVCRRGPGVARKAPGTPISAAQLSGTWKGELRLYPAPFLPVEMVLALAQSGAQWRGHLKLNFHAKERPDESLDLGDLAVGETEFTFTDPGDCRGSPCGTGGERWQWRANGQCGRGRPAGPLPRHMASAEGTVTDRRDRLSSNSL